MIGRTNVGAKSAIRPVSRPYDEDFVLWATETARLLREGRLDAIDIEHLAEEVEDMANRDKRELLSRLTVLVQHLLKWQWQPGKRSKSWQTTLVTQRTELKRLFEQSPSLRRSLSESLAKAYPDAARLAAIETGLALPSECPFSPMQILDENFLPEP